MNLSFLVARRRRVAVPSLSLSLSLSWRQEKKQNKRKPNTIDNSGGWSFPSGATDRTCFRMSSNPLSLTPEKEKQSISLLLFIHVSVFVHVSCVLFMCLSQPLRSFLTLPCSSLFLSFHDELFAAFSAPLCLLMVIGTSLLRSWSVFFRRKQHGS